MRFGLRWSVAAAALVAAAGCGYSGMGTYGAAAPAPCTLASATALAGATVTMQGMAFAPACAKVTAPVTVTFANDDTVQHTVTSDTGAFAEHVLDPGQTASETFNAAGTVGIHCRLHLPGMRLTLFVQ